MEQILVTVVCCIACSAVSIIVTAFITGSHINSKEFAKKLNPIRGDMAKCPNCAAVLRVGNRMNVTNYCDCCGQRVINDREGVIHG